MSSSDRKGSRARFAVRVLLAVTAVVTLIAIVPRDQLAGALGALPLAAWPLAVTSYLSVHLLGLCKWRLLMGTARATLDWRSVARYYYYGLFGNLFLPSMIGGDVVRLALALRDGARSGGVLVGSFADRLIDLWALLLLAAWGAWGLPDAITGSAGATLRIVGLLLVLLPAAGLFLLRLVPSHRLPERLRRHFLDARASVDAVRRRPAALLAALGLALLLQSLLLLFNVALARAMHLGIPPAAWLFVWPLAKLSAIVPLTQGGIGLREGVQVALLTALGFAAADGLAVGLAFQGIVVAGNLAAGLVAFLLHRSERRRSPF